MNADQLHDTILQAVDTKMPTKFVWDHIDAGPLVLPPEQVTVHYANGDLRAALRAVVELHVPELFGGFIACLACSPGMPPPTLVLWKNCASIRAVASALGVEVPDG